MKTMKLRKPAATAVLNRLLAEPNLVVTIQSLSPERLGALIHSVGLEDAGELVALATTEQLTALFDDDLWTNGDEVNERFDAERFALWLEVLFEAGEALVVERLTQLPQELVCVAVSKFAYVVNLDALWEETENDERYLSRVESALESSSSEEWEEFRLIDRGLRGFDVMLTALFALDTAHHRTLRGILERVCDMTTQEVEERGGLIKALQRLEAAEESLRAERQERRAARGFVSMADARAFIDLTNKGLDYEAGRDPITHAYIRDVYGKEQAQAALRVASARTSRARLVEVVHNAVQVPTRSSVGQVLGEALELLQRHRPHACEQRLAELAYLTNVLITLSQPRERRLRPIEASEAVLVVCASGLEALGVSGASSEELSLALPDVLLDMAFRAGWAKVANRQDEPLAKLLRQLSTFDRMNDVAS